jgi:hypothetical protein
LTRQISFATSSPSSREPVTYKAGTNPTALHGPKAIFNAGLIPNINENPRNRKTPKRGRKQLFNAAIHSLRLCVKRSFAWED